MRTTAPLTTIERRTRITRLGQGVNESCGSSRGEMTRTVDVIREYQEVIVANAVTGVRAAATSTSRDVSTATTSSTRWKSCSAFGPSC